MLLAMLVKVTVALGTAAPEESFTYPSTDADSNCALALTKGRSRKSARASRSHAVVPLMFVLPLLIRILFCLRMKLALRTSGDGFGGSQRNFLALVFGEKGTPGSIRCQWGNCYDSVNVKTTSFS